VSLHIQKGKLTQMTEMQDDLDFLGLIAARRHAVIRLGPVEVGTGLVRGNLNNAMNQMATGHLVLDFKQTTGKADYFGGISVLLGQGNVEAPRFTGSVISAKPVEDGTEIEAISAVSLSESVTPGMMIRGVPPTETIYVLARTAGIPDARLRIGGLAELPRETFEVLVPIEGVSIDSATYFGDILLVPPSAAERATIGLNMQGELKEAFEGTAYALAFVTTARMFEAEEKGLAAVDLALAWLTTQLRYGLTHLPDETALAFDRKESLAEVVRKDAVFVRGLTTLRQWIRTPRSAKQARFVSLSRTERPLDGTLPALTLQDQLALSALARATRERDSLAQVQALWEAIEFYASGTVVSEMFTKAERKAIRRAVNDALPSLSDDRRNRVEYAIGQLNNAPLLIRLKKSLDQEGVPIADGEITLLSKLRDLRNDVVHGRNSIRPEAEDVEYAVSIVARMLLFRVSNYRRKEAE
jgi:hypothetical protein